MSPRNTFLFKVLHSQKVNPHLSFKSDNMYVSICVYYVLMPSLIIAYHNKLMLITKFELTRARFARLKTRSKKHLLRISIVVLQFFRNIYINGSM